jgi:hypothetical protein
MGNEPPKKKMAARKAAKAKAKGYTYTGAGRPVS